MPPFARLFRATLLGGAALFALTVAAQAASFTVNPAPPTDTTAKTLAGGDIGTIAAGGILSSSTDITWLLGTATTATAIINNSGTITATSRGIDTSSNGGGAARSFTLNNLAGSLIDSGNDGFRVNNDIGAGTVTVDNFGTIQSATGQALDFASITTTTGYVVITNESTGVIKALDADAIRPGNSAMIYNYGQISAATTGDSGNDGIDFQDTGSGTLTNYQSGSILGARHGLTAKQNVTVNNYGILTGQAGSGINLDTTGGISTVINYATGVITGTAVGGDGDGIDVDYGVNVTNYGTIQAVGLAPSGNLNEALAIGGGTIVNMAGGLIISDQRAITVDDSNLGNAPVLTAIDNAGTITGSNGQAIQLTSTFADTLINRASGVINGSVTMGAGDNVVTLYAGSTLNGALDGGAGGDTIHLTGSGHGTLTNVSNVETLNVDAATWTLSGGQSYAGGITVAAGATAQVSGTLSGNVTNNGTVTVNGTSAQFDGTFQNNGAYISDPSTQSFVNLAVGTNGYIQAADGDRYAISGDFINTSTQNVLWKTSQAYLEFTGSGDHTMDVVGHNVGAIANVQDNFKWGTLELDSGNNLYLADSLGLGAGAALYVDGLVGAQIAGDLITNIFGVNGLTLFYNRDDAANGYLNGLNYYLSGGGRLVAAVPEPLTLSLFGAGLAGLVVMTRRKRSAFRGKHA